MAAVSGLFAARAYVLRWTPDALADAVNRGIAIGFILGVMPAVWAFMIVMTIR